MITRDAFLSRIRRRLAQDGQRLIVRRDNICIVDIHTRLQLASDCTIATLERDYQVLRPGEEVAE